MLSVLGFLGPSPPPRWYRRTWAGRKGAIALAGPYDPLSYFDVETEAGNVLVIEGAYNPSGAEAFVGQDGIAYPTAPGIVGRQDLDYSEYDRRTLDWITVTGSPDGITATGYFNNATPTVVGTIPNQQAYTNIQIVPIILTTRVSDAENDAITFTVVSGTLPTGLVIDPAYVLDVGLPSERIVAAITGTPVTGQQGTDTIVIRATDAIGAYVDLAAFDLVTGIGQQMPDVVDEVLQDGLDAIALVMTSSDVTTIFVADELIAIGRIVETQPVAGAYRPPGSPVVVTVSGAEIPPHVSIDEATVTAALEALTLVVTTAEASSDVIAEGLVISMTDNLGVPLLAGDIVAGGSSVTIIVSSGTIVIPYPVVIDRVYFRLSQAKTVLRVLH